MTPNAETFNDTSKGFVFTGFPRTQEQAKFLTSIMEGQNRCQYKPVILNFTCSDHEKILKRSAKLRAGAPSSGGDIFAGRADQLTQEKLDKYNEGVAAVARYFEAEKYAEDKIVYEIDAN